jgi:hypothetical protein
MATEQYYFTDFLLKVKGADVEECGAVGKDTP